MEAIVRGDDSMGMDSEGLRLQAGIGAVNAAQLWPKGWAL